MSIPIPAVTASFEWDCWNNPATTQGAQPTWCGQTCGAGGYNVGADFSDAGNPNLYGHIIRITRPDGTTLTGSILFSNGWVSASGAGYWVADVRAFFGAVYYDQEAGGSLVTGIGTPKGRPNHIRQVHGGYALLFDSDITWTATALLNYMHPLTLEEANALYGEETGWEHVGEEVSEWADADDSGTQGTLVGGVRATIYDPFDATDLGEGLPMLHYSCGIGYNGGIPCTLGTGFAALTGALTRCTANLNVYNNADPNVTSCAGLTVTARKHDDRGDAFSVGPDMKGTLASAAPEWDGGEVGLKGFPVYPGSTGLEATSGSTWAGTVNNSTGPGWYYAWSRPLPPSGWTVQTPFSFPLNPDRGRDQAHWYGRYERLWARPPEAGASWSPFTVGHVASVLVDDMTSSHPDQTVNNLSGGVAGYYEWTGTNLGTGGATGVSGGYRTVTVASDAAAPTLSRRLQSDWDDCEADPSAFRDDAGTPAGVAAYIGKAHSAPYNAGTGYWYNVRRKVRAGADVYNWGNHRWLRVRGEGGGEWTLRVFCDVLEISDNFTLGELATNPEATGLPAERVITVSRTSGGYVDCGPYQFGATDTDIYIDLAEAAARSGLNLVHVVRVDILLSSPGSGSDTWYFDSIRLCSGQASSTPNTVNEAAPDFRAFAGVPYADDTCLIPVADGRACCVQDDVAGLAPWVLTAVIRQTQSVPPDWQPRPVDESKTMAELATEIGFQEGITVSAVAEPGDDFTAFQWAIFLDAGEYADGQVDATVKCREIRVPALLEETWPARELYGAKLYGVAIDSADRWPASGTSVTVEGVEGGGLYDSLTSLTTDANGAFSSPAVPQSGRGLWQTALDDDDPARQPLYSAHRLTAPGLLVGGSPVSASHACPNRQATYYALIGEAPAADTAAGVALAVSETGAMARAFDVGPNVRVQRRTWDGGAWQTIGERAGSLGDVAWLDGRVLAVFTDAGAVKLWDTEDGALTTIAAAGSYGRFAIGENGALTAYTYWRADRHRVRVHDAMGNDLYGEVTVQGSNVPEGAMDIDWRSDGTLEGVYHDGVGQVSVVSETGEVWT